MRLPRALCGGCDADPPVRMVRHCGSRTLDEAQESCGTAVRTRSRRSAEPYEDYVFVSINRQRSIASCA